MKICAVFIKKSLFNSFFMPKLMLDSAEYTQFSIAMNVKDEEKGTMKNNVPYFYIQNY